MKKHAVLSPSKSSRWLICTPSARLEEKVQRSSSDAADEGTTAHLLSELLIRETLGERVKPEIQKVKTSKYYNKAMLEHCETFASYVVEKFNAIKEKYEHAVIILESELDLSKYIPEGHGTGDVIILAGNYLFVIDLKYGKGIHVEVEENTQMMIYALGAMDNFNMLFDKIKFVEMTIYQPRLGNIETFKMTAANLENWGKEVVAKQAKLAFAGKGNLIAGSHCDFCAVKATCKANAAYNMELAKEEFVSKEPAELKDADLVKIYLRAREIKGWLDAVEKHMVDKAVTGKKWKGLKLVHGRSMRIITNPKAVLAILKRKKLPTELFLSEPQLLGITALEQNIGAKEFFKIAGKYVEKPLGKPSLVHADDKRKEYNVNESAKEDFS